MVICKILSPLLFYNFDLTIYFLKPNGVLREAMLGESHRVDLSTKKFANNNNPPQQLLLCEVVS